MSPGVVQDPHAQDLELNGAEPAEDEQDQETEADVEGGAQPQDGAVQKPKPRRHRPRISMPKRKKRAEPVSAPPPVEEPAIVTAPRKTSRPKKLTLLPASTDHIDEPLYCVCRGISAGTVSRCRLTDIRRSTILSRWLPATTRIARRNGSVTHFVSVSSIRLTPLPAGNKNIYKDQLKYRPSTEISLTLSQTC